MFSTHKLNMEISGALNQYMNICRDTFNGYTAKLNKSTKYVVIETLLLFMVIPRKINFTQLSRYGNRCEQCYRQTFSKKFDWVQYNMNLMEKFFGKNDRKAIAIDPSYISKSGKHTPNIGYFWSGVAGAAKRGLEILGIGIIDIDMKDCLMLKAEQTPNAENLQKKNYTLIEWYLHVLEGVKDRLLTISKYVVADAYFAKATFAQGLMDMGFHLVSRLRDDANLMYIYNGKPVYGEKIDFDNLDYSKMERIETDSEDEELYTLVAYSKAMKRNIRLVIWRSSIGKHKLYFSTDIDMSGKEVIEFYRTRFQIEFCYRDAKQYDVPFSVESLKSLIFNSYLLDRFFKLSGVRPNKRINAKLVKELIDIAAYRAA